MNRALALKTALLMIQDIERELGEHLVTQTKAHWPLV